MAKKRLGGKPGEEAEAEEADEAAREIGRLQKRVREIERAKPARPPPSEPPRRLFSGGAKESHEEESADEPFRAADMLRSLSPQTSPTGEVERYKRGPKKGQPKFKPRGTLRQRNEEKLRKYVGKEIRIVVKFDKLSRGGLERKAMRRTRTLTYQTYDGLVHAYQDTMRGTINEESEAAYYVETVDFEPPPSRAGKRRRKKRKKKARRAAHSASVRRTRTGKRR